MRHTFCTAFNFTPFGVFRLRLIFKTELSSSFQIFAVFLTKMAKHDVTKTPFSQNSRRIFRNFGGRRQFDAGEGTESFASISAAVFELSRKSGRGGAIFAPPPAVRVLSNWLPCCFSVPSYNMPDVLWRAIPLLLGGCSNVS